MTIRINFNTIFRLRIILLIICYIKFPLILLSQDVLSAKFPIYIFAEIWLSCDCICRDLCIWLWSLLYVDALRYDIRFLLPIVFDKSFRFRLYRIIGVHDCNHIGHILGLVHIYVSFHATGSCECLSLCVWMSDLNDNRFRNQPALYLPTLFGASLRQSSYASSI